MPGGEVFPRVFRRKEPWDIFLDDYGSDFDDPGDYINALAIDNAFNFSHYHSPALSRRIRAASRLSGVSRAQAYARIDLGLVRDTVPDIFYGNGLARDLFSARIGCQLYQPVEGMDLGALCIRAASR